MLKNQARLALEAFKSSHKVGVETGGDSQDIVKSDVFSLKGA